MLEVGVKAPDFEIASDQNGRVHRLSDYGGKSESYISIPKDNTAGCTETGPK